MNTITKFLKDHWTLLLFWGALYLAILPFVEMRASDEAILAGVARDILEHRHFLPTDFHFQGRPCSIFPLYPWLAALCSLVCGPSAFAVRLPSALAVLALSLLAGKMARRYKDDYAGLAASLVVLTSFATMRVAFRAQTETLHALLMTLAWFSWYNLGPQRNRWGWAWSLALLCVFLDLLNVGLRAALLFYIPIVFTRMPPRVQRRLFQPAHLLHFLTYALLAYVWLALGKQPVFAGSSLAASPFSLGGEGFFHHFFTFPVKALLYLMPWTILAWTPFCEAQRRFEPAGSLCGFLRAIFLWPFLLTWLAPGTSTLLLLPLLPALAVLIGLHAQVVLHRHARTFQRLAKCIGVLAAIAMFLLAIGWLLVDSGTLLISPAPDLLPCLPPIALSRLARTMELLLLAAASLTIWRTRTASNAARLGWCAFACAFAYFIGFAIPLDNLLLPDRDFAARSLLGTLPQRQAPGVETTQENAARPLADANLLYLETNDPIAAQLYGQMYYLGLPVAHVQSLPTDLPPEQTEVWLLSQKFPLYANWSWEPAFPEYNLNQLRNLQIIPANPSNAATPLWKALFHGGLRLQKVYTEAPENGGKATPRYRPPARFRLYRGRRTKS